MDCKHEKAYWFHENAPAYCPTCDNYVDGGKIVGKKKENE